MRLKNSYEYLVGGEKEFESFQERNRGLRELGAKVRSRTATWGNKYGARSQEVDIFSDGTRMSGTLWMPATAQHAAKESLPALLMCHGWGGIRENLDAVFAPAFAKAGFVVLTFDYRGWNTSDAVIISHSTPAGTTNKRQQDAARCSDSVEGSGATVDGLRGHLVRNLVDMDWQLTDIEAALDFLDGEDVVDSNRIGIWGISQGGGHVISTAARQRGRVKAVVAMVPSCGDVGAGSPRERLPQARKDAILRARGLKPLSVPQNVKLHHLPHMDGVPNLSKLCRYRPLETAHLIECPILVVDADQEEVFRREENGLAAFEIISKRNPRSEYALFSGRHYDAYDGAQGQYKFGIERAIAFFKACLQPASLAKL